MKRIALTIALALALATSAPMLQAEGTRNLKYLGGLTPTQLKRTMNFMRASLGVNCDFCHVSKSGELDFASDEKKEKVTARKMIALVIDTNSRYFDERTAVTCTTCHRGSIRPVVLPNLPQQPQPSMPSAVRPVLPSRDEVMARYAAALGRPDPDVWCSRILKGTRVGQDGKREAITILETADSLRLETADVVVLTDNGGWIKDAKGARELPPDDLESLRELNEAFRPLLPDDVPSTARVVRKIDLKIAGESAWVVEYSTGPTVRQQLYFDSRSGLLLRRVSLTATPIAEVPLQTDYLDYRKAGGTKFPFTIRVESVDPRLDSTRRYTAVKLGATPAADRFTMPKEH